jgi:hypothetical protein
MKLLLLQGITAATGATVLGVLQIPEMPDGVARPCRHVDRRSRAGPVSRPSRAVIVKVAAKQHVWVRSVLSGARYLKFDGLQSPVTRGGLNRERTASLAEGGCGFGPTDREVYSDESKRCHY